MWLRLVISHLHNVQKHNARKIYVRPQSAREWRERVASCTYNWIIFCLGIKMAHSSNKCWPSPLCNVSQTKRNETKWKLFFMFGSALCVRAVSCMWMVHGFGISFELILLCCPVVYRIWTARTKYLQFMYKWRAYNTRSWTTNHFWLGSFKMQHTKHVYSSAHANNVSDRPATITPAQKNPYSTHLSWMTRQRSAAARCNETRNAKRPIVAGAKNK